MERIPPREIIQVNALEIPLSREQHQLRQVNNRLTAQERRKREFLDEYNWDEVNAPSIILTEEAMDLKHWCSHQSWTHYPNCMKLSMKKLLPSFRRTKFATYRSAHIRNPTHRPHTRTNR